MGTLIIRDSPQLVTLNWLRNLQTANEVLIARNQNLVDARLPSLRKVSSFDNKAFPSLLHFSLKKQSHLAVLFNFLSLTVSHYTHYSCRQPQTVSQCSATGNYPLQHDRCDPHSRIYRRDADNFQHARLHRPIACRADFGDHL